MRDSISHDKSRSLRFEPYDVDTKKCINSIGRAALNTTVIEAAQRYPNVRVHFNHRCANVDLDSATAHLVASFVESGVPATPKPGEGGSPANVIHARGDAGIGVDGAFSAVRQ